VSALDKSVEAQVLNLLLDLKDEFGLTYVFISHDLNVVRYISDRVMVMYLGRWPRSATARRCSSDPRHPYTRALLSSASRRWTRTTAPRSPPLAGDPPNPINPPSGCRFHTRCDHAPSRVQPARAHAGGRRRRPPGGLPDARAGSGHSGAPATQGGGMNSTGRSDRPLRRHQRTCRHLHRRQASRCEAVNGVDLQVQRGEVVALIGESGSGKSVTLRSLLRLHPPRRTQIGGQMLVGGQDVLKMSPRAAGRLPRQGRVDDLPGAAAGAGPGVHGGRADRREHPPPRAVSAEPRPTSARWSCSSGCASPARSGGWQPIRTR
jgi:oligopeptide/dipeptide ABC transporter ATP-binding protein